MHWGHNSSCGRTGPCLRPEWARLFAASRPDDDESAVSQGGGMGAAGSMGGLATRPTSR
jgi:hypothetical protein